MDSLVCYDLFGLGVERRETERERERVFERVIYASYDGVY
jgi:hypothetical protein